MTKGTVKWFNSRRGYGFITPNDSFNDVFIHYSEINGARNEYKTLYEGDVVEFEIVEGRKGLQAQDVEVIEHAPRKSYQSRGYYF